MIDEIKKYKIKTIKHNDKDYFICLVRKKLIQAKPEEIFRQQLLYYIIDDLKYPIETIDVEVPISYFKKRAKGRADIVIHKENINATKEVVLLIECKAPNVDIRDYRFKRQIDNYNKILNSDFSILTNGTQFEITDNKKEKNLDFIPSYIDLIKKKRLKYISKTKFVWKKHSYEELFDLKTHKDLIGKDIISDVTPHKIIPPIIRLMDFLYFDGSKISPFKMGDLQLIRDYGLRFSNYGTAFGDGLKGYYRYFLLKQKDGNHRIVSFSIYHQTYWGTYLMVAVDERQGHSLELKLDKYLLEKSENKYLLTHNGSLTVGKKGRMKNSIVLNYIKKRASDLLRDNKINLGEFDIKKELNVNEIAIKELIYRISKYAILREDIRKMNA